MQIGSLALILCLVLVASAGTLMAKFGVDRGGMAMIPGTIGAVLMVGGGGFLFFNLICAAFDAFSVPSR